jgi:hypothetical protein
LSAAFALTVRALETVAPFAGEVIDTVGGVVSGVALAVVKVRSLLVATLLLASLDVTR